MQAPDDFNPPVGRAEQVAPGVRRILCGNPSAFTYRGTNTYLVGSGDLAVIDPGPDDAAHLAAILSAPRAGERITQILVTHAHRDHSPLARALSRETGAPVLAYGGALAGQSEVMRRLAQSGEIGGGEGADSDFVPDVSLPDGATVSGEGWHMTAIWTPGHFGNHMVFDLRGTVFCGDLVMGWATSIVSPPDGDLTDFMASCERLRARAPRRLLPGHGAPIEQPGERIDWLLAHRRTREAAILEALAAGPAASADLAARIYTDIPAAMLPAATRNVLAHLIDLMGKNRVAPEGDLTAATVFRRLS
ncbi:MBL fold metallo-hydrolase [Pseudooceanicola sp. 216_PA32_1]|uniref:MBL fold metallo-hydrolase n=1 Tax=Pseudooceanicola pacificus TaxID=2676438 RepID=A0A844W5H4_9RHOB|nr:MBL fold metallo-hydrolase [Pseudooceanicola pacificus]MWB77974.1 MBL fold metallo-hydrolase [Pseudooceanicola pacificus]